MPAKSAPVYVSKSAQKERRRKLYARNKAQGLLNPVCKIELLNGSTIERVVRGQYFDMGMTKKVSYQGRRIEVELIGRENGVYIFQESEQHE